MYFRPKKLTLGIKNDNNLCYELEIPEDSTVESLVAQLKPQRRYLVHCLYNNDNYMAKIAEVSPAFKNKICKTNNYEGLKDLKVLDCWVEFSPEAVGYNLYFLTDQEDLSEPTFFEKLDTYLTENPFISAICVIFGLVILAIVLTVNWVGLLIIAAAFVPGILITFLITLFAENARLKRYTKIYARARQKNR